MMTTVLATGLAEAVRLDEAPDQDGFDLSAGLFGKHVSDWLRTVANEFGAITPATTADARDAALLRALLRHGSQIRPRFDRAGTLRELAIICRPTVCTSGGFRDEVRKTLAELATTGSAAWPDDPVEGG